MAAGAVRYFLQRPLPWNETSFPGGVSVATRTTPPPKLGEKEQAAFIEKVKAIAPKYRTELLREA